MINKSTVLILGAGASMDYGFPSGPKLMTEIVNLFEENPRQKKAINILYKLNVLNYSPDSIYYSGEGDATINHVPAIWDDFKEINALIHAIKFSGAASIDDLLHHRPDLAEIGKLAIAQIISNHEKEESYINALSKTGEGFEHSENWYAYLWKYLYSDGAKEN